MGRVGRVRIRLTRRQVSQGLNGTYRDILNTYWQNQVTKLETEDHDYKIHQLPLARIKKVMKADPEVKMISAEAPILFAKGCDIFITELTMRAWIHAEENKRRTLQRSDIASALAKSDMFDFLIDIVPREDATPQHKRRPEYTPVGTYAVPDPSNPGAGSGGMVSGQEQQQMGGQPEYGMEQPHLAQQPQYQQQTGMYPPPAPQQQFSGNQMFDPNMYAQPPQAYGMGQMQQMPQAVRTLVELYCNTPRLTLLFFFFSRCINQRRVSNTRKWASSTHDKTSRAAWTSRMERASRSTEPTVSCCSSLAFPCLAM